MGREHSTRVWRQSLKVVQKHVPRPCKGVKFQPLGLFLVVKGLKYHTLGGSRRVYEMISEIS